MSAIQEYTVAEMDQMARDQAAAALANHVIQKRYPGYPFCTHVEGGMLKVWLETTGDRYGYQLHQKGLTQEQVVMAAGEILERYNLRRGGIDVAQVNSAPRDRLGRMLGDLG